MNKRQIVLALCAMILAGVIVGVADFIQGIDISAAAAASTPAASTPPNSDVIPGRTYDPNAVLVTPRGSGTVYYVDGMNGSDANDGRTIEKAFKTIGKAVDRYSSPLRAGDPQLAKGGAFGES
jgi:hypothetical protein